MPSRRERIEQAQDVHLYMILNYRFGASSVNPYTCCSGFFFRGQFIHQTINDRVKRSKPYLTTGLHSSSPTPKELQESDWRRPIKKYFRRILLAVLAFPTTLFPPLFPFSSYYSLVHYSFHPLVYCCVAEKRMSSMINQNDERQNAG